MESPTNSASPSRLKPCEGKAMKTEQQRKNLEEALNVMWPSVPPENVSPSLGEWRHETGMAIRSASSSPPSCGTIACFGGWCAWWPYFREQGVSSDGSGMPITSGYLGVAEVLFGDARIFAGRGAYVSDALVPVDTSDHDLVTARLKYALEQP